MVEIGRRRDDLYPISSAGRFLCSKTQCNRCGIGRTNDDSGDFNRFGENVANLRNLRNLGEISFVPCDSVREVETWKGGSIV